jgi:diphthamide biosynthesis methyltransferase
VGGGKISEQPRYMTFGQCAQQMLEIEQRKARV